MLDKKTDQKDDGLPVDIKLQVKHALSRELQLYFDKITELTVSKADSVLYKEALVRLSLPCEDQRACLLFNRRSFSRVKIGQRLHLARS